MFKLLSAALLKGVRSMVHVEGRMLNLSPVIDNLRQNWRSKLLNWNHKT